MTDALTTAEQKCPGIAIGLSANDQKRVNLLANILIPEGARLSKAISDAEQYTSGSRQSPPSFETESMRAMRLQYINSSVQTSLAMEQRAIDNASAGKCQMATIGIASSSTLLDSLNRR